jgi:flagellar FliL protein
MSEEGKEPTKKKGGKMPIIIALVLILAGGGFFMMKSKGGGKKEKPAIELGEVQTMPEFLVNLKDGQTYLRTEVALQTQKGFEKEAFDKVTPAVRDAIVLKLSSKSLGEISTVDGKNKLKKEIAKVVNDAIGPPESDSSDDDGDKKKKKKKSDDDEHDDWDSQTGPVLKVFFTNFATQ